MEEDKVKIAEQAQTTFKTALTELNELISDELNIVLEDTIPLLEAIIAKVDNLEYRPNAANIAINLLMQLRSTLGQINTQVPMLVAPPVPSLV